MKNRSTVWTQRGLQAAATCGIGMIHVAYAPYEALYYRWDWPDKKFVHIGTWHPGKSLSPFQPILKVPRGSFIKNKNAAFARALLKLKPKELR